jgi:hypothetical protein
MFSRTWQSSCVGHLDRLCPPLVAHERAGLTHPIVVESVRKAVDQHTIYIWLNYPKISLFYKDTALLYDSLHYNARRHVGKRLPIYETEVTNIDLS